MKFSQEQKPSEKNVQAKPNTEDVELNEDQLEAVAGGATGEIIGIIRRPGNDCTTQPITPTFPEDKIYFE